MLTINPVDEAIWHFIGLFEITEERGRMWVDYDRFAALKIDVDPGGIEPLDLVTKAPLDLRDLTPSIRYTPPSVKPPEVSTEAPYFPPSPIVQDMPADAVGAVPSLDLQKLFSVAPHMVPYGPPPPVDFHVTTPHWILQPPESVAVVVVQWNRIDDDDMVNVDQMQGGVVSAEAIAARLEGLLDQAAQLGVSLDVSMPANEGSYHEIAQTFQALFEKGDGAPVDVEGSISVTLRGDAVEGKYLNGVAVDERPDISEYFPDYRDKDDEEEDETADTGSSDGPQTASGAVAGPGDADDDDGPDHEMVHGNNTLVNEAHVTAAWFAAPVVVAGGNAYSYNVISQTNVWSDTDSVSGNTTPAVAGGEDPTVSLNYSSYANVSNPIPIPDGTGEAPQYWVTATLEGSLISCNWIEQYNLVSDNDVTAITIMGEKTLYMMGENGALNQVSLTELGTAFDLMVIDGHVINLNAVLQTNVLLDDDRIMVSGGQAAISSGDNLLVNDATINQIGETGLQATSAGQNALLADAADGAFTLPQSLLNDPAFRDLDLVRVLHVKGDLVSLNFIRQTNVLGDADQIEVYGQQFMDGPGEMSVVSGSNVLLNSAIITEFGVDSTIYAGGHLYSDALLHQAELISTDAPLMPQGGALASEAVLFLAEGMLTDEMDDIEFRPIGADHAPSADAMETVLA
ncbi:hypothetical protein [Paracoccus zhejiangensis]|uniref:Type I secretion protein ATPase n=1 Tax=Paracoccus zhejiangensis TaxID=1077935 RepID=A0A2H5F1H4_9RHOB|nr:hypothetical protein [Paracoccus zhejiangensis]AUH65386.1 hypothetical protein CX676_15440 [Paracoccus zhejiangensis]